MIARSIIHHSRSHSVACTVVSTSKNDVKGVCSTQIWQQLIVRQRLQPPQSIHISGSVKLASIYILMILYLIAYKFRVRVALRERSPILPFPMDKSRATVPTASVFGPQQTSIESEKCLEKHRTCLLQ